MNVDPYLAAGAVVLLLIAILVIRTAMFQSRQVNVELVETPALDANAPTRLAKALQFKTITQRDPAKLDTAAYGAFREYLAEAFPSVHEAMDQTVINEHSMLYGWEGSDPAAAPIVLAAHYDVVPVDAPDQWDHEPFSGTIHDDYIYGRGALDDKASVVALFESMETLIANGYEPRRTVYLAIGHDEEVGGEYGAKAIAEHSGGRGRRTGRCD